jgi:hypothetical protein
MLGENILHYFYFNHKNDKCYFVDRDLNANDITLRPIIDLINQKKPECVLYNYPTEASVEWLMECFDINGNFKIYNQFYELEKTLIDNNCHFFLILGGNKPKIFSPFENNIIKNFKILYWPTYLISHTYNGLKNSYLNPRGLDGPLKVSDLKIEKTFNKLYLNYNNKPRYHRCLMIDELFNNNLFSVGLNSWNLKQNDCETAWDLIGGDKRIHEFKYWKEELLNVDDYKSKKNGIIDEYTDMILNSGCFMSLVGESSIDAPFITEKTFRPIMIEQPFLCYGAKHQNKDLIKLGFELYDEIFDYEFDENEDIMERIDGVIKNLIKIKDKDYYKLYELIKPKILRNKEKSLELIFNDTMNPLIEFYQKYGHQE